MKPTIRVRVVRRAREDIAHVARLSITRDVASREHATVGHAPHVGEHRARTRRGAREITNREVMMEEEIHFGYARTPMAAKKTKAKPTKSAKTKKVATKKVAPTKKPAKKVTPKTSPLKGIPVTAWLKQKTSGWQTKIIERIIAMTKRAAPDATLSIKWAQPVFDVSGPMAFIKPAEAHVTFGFWRGAELGDPAGILEGGDRMKHVKITADDVLNEARLAAFVREAAALNRAKGDPTKR
jgi:hypothetical protein